MITKSGDEPDKQMLRGKTLTQLILRNEIVLPLKYRDQDLCDVRGETATVKERDDLRRATNNYHSQI